jgi:pyrroline-5-carboxylate reductase
MPRLTDLDIGVIGVGEIAAAMVEGLYAEPEAAPRVHLSPRGAGTARTLAERYAGALEAALEALLHRVTSAGGAGRTPGLS